MLRKQFRIIGDIVLALLLGLIIWCRNDRGAADYYALKLYPHISNVLSRLSSAVPFTLEELIVLAFVAAMVLAVILGVRGKERWHVILGRELRLLLVVYVWFYAGWGLNYSRSSLSQRTGTPLAQFDEDAFRSFLADYAAALNESYEASYSLPADLEQEVRDFYAGRSQECGLAGPKDWQAPKKALASALFSKVGVTGSMGPFMGESMLNGDMPESEYPFTFAHEFAHLMGVSSEAEANYWGFRFCKASRIPAVRYSGYCTLLGNVLRNARRLLPEDEYAEFVGSVREEVRDDYNARVEFWAGKYSKALGKIQDVMYNAYLKGNGISSGTRNYDEFVGLVMTFGDGL